jgi:hypothetical protein
MVAAMVREVMSLTVEVGSRDQNRRSCWGHASHKQDGVVNNGRVVHLLRLARLMDTFNGAQHR